MPEATAWATSSAARPWSAWRSTTIRFLQPVYAGDELFVEAEVLAVSQSKSKPDRGYLVLRVVTHRRNDSKAVPTPDWTLLMPRRESERELQRVVPSR